MRGFVVAVVVIGLCAAVFGPAVPASGKVIHKKRAHHSHGSPGKNKAVGTNAKAKTHQGSTAVKVKPQTVKKTPLTVDATKVAPTEEVPASPKPRSEVTSAAPTPAPVPATTASQVYTCLVIDATGFKLDKAMGPKVYRKCGSEVWGTLKNLTDADYDILQDRGMVAYAKSIEEAKSDSRAGANPLIVKAVDTKGEKLRCDLIVADEDGDLILAANEKGKFLDKFNVILIQNETPPAPPPAPAPAPGTAPSDAPASSPPSGG